MEVNGIIVDGKPIGNQDEYKDAVSYLNQKFGNLTPDQVKSFILAKGTMLSDSQVIGVQTDVLYDRVHNIKDPQLIWKIEEILEALAEYFKIPNGRYNEL